MALFLLVGGCSKSKNDSDQSSLAEGCSLAGTFPFSKPNANFKSSSFKKIAIDANQLRLQNSDEDLEESQLGKLDTSKVFLKAQSALTIAVDNACFLESGGGPFLEKIPSAVSLNWQKFMRGKRAYFSHRFAEDINYSELLKWIDADSCVLAVNTQRYMYPVAFPTDPKIAEQSHWSAVGFDTAYDNFFDGVSGATTTITVAVIDSGVDLDHEDLSAHIWTNAGETAGNGTDDDSNGYIDDINGYHFQAEHGDPDPSSEEAYTSHGTAVAGLIGAVDNTVGVVGVMSQFVQMMSLNVFGTAAGTTDALLAEALDYAVANGANIVNMSVGGLGTTPTTEVALQNAISGGVFVAVAAGNSGIEIDSGSNFFSPAGYAKDLNGVIAVGATSSSNSLATYYSNYSSTYVELMAPGSILVSNSTFLGVYTLDYDDGYQNINGTSFSSPIVAGAAALAWSLIKTRGGTPTPSDVEEYLRTSGKRYINLSGKVHDCRHLEFNDLYDAIDADHP